MKIQQNLVNYNIGFNGKIIDSHTHVGHWFNDNFTVRDLLASVNPDGDTVDKIIVSNLDCFVKQPDKDAYFGTEYSGNINLLNDCKNNTILKPLAVCMPNVSENADTIRKVLDEGKFYGLKFHPDCSGISVDNSKYDDYLKVAEERNLPCLFHCSGKDSGLSSPQKIYELAKKHPNVSVILGHMGAGGKVDHEEAVRVMLEAIKNKDAKIYADISWVDCSDEAKPNIISAIKKLINSGDGNHIDRIMFGSDSPLGVFGEKGIKQEGIYSKTVNDIKNAIRAEFKENADDIINKIFFQNAEDLFFSSPVQTITMAEQETFNQSSKGMSKTKIGAICIAALVISGGTMAYFHNKKQNTEKIDKRPSLVSRSISYNA